jgi:hypothetical protein
MGKMIRNQVPDSFPTNAAEKGDGPIRSLPTEAHSMSPSLGAFAEMNSPNTGESDFAISPDQQPRGSDGLPPEGVTSFHWSSEEPQLKGPDHVPSTNNSARELGSICSASKQIVETNFAELNNGTLVDLVQDSGNPSRTLLAVWKDGHIRYLDQLETDGGVLVPLQRTNESFKRLRLPTEASPYESVQTLLSRIESLISRCVSVDTGHLEVLADFVLSTWLVDRFEMAPYLSVVGLPQSGKTTLLKVLSLLCRRPFLIADITSASFYRACAQFNPTMLIDEAGSIGNNPALRHILRAGSTRDVDSVQANRTFHAYGAKVLSWLEPPDDTALNSRCILIPMFESMRTDLLRPSDKDVEWEAGKLQAQLLQFRFENYWRVKPRPIPGDEILRPRSRNLLRALVAPHLQDVERCERLFEFFYSGQAVPQEPLSPEQNAVLRALFSVIHLRKEFYSIQTGQLTEMVNLFLERAGEKLRMQPRKVGAALSSLGISNRTRTKSGWLVTVNRKDAEKMHQLAEHYGIERLEDRFQKVSPEECEMCRVAAHKGSVRTPQVPEGSVSTSCDLRKELGPQRR